MKTMVLNLPSLAFIVATRAALAGGVGLLLSSKLPAPRRRAIGGMLVAIGVATTIPAAMSVFRGLRRSRQRDESLIGATRLSRKADDEDDGA